MRNGPCIWDLQRTNSSHSQLGRRRGHRNYARTIPRNSSARSLKHRRHQRTRDFGSKFSRSWQASSGLPPRLSSTSVQTLGIPSWIFARCSRFPVPFRRLGTTSRFGGRTANSHGCLRATCMFLCAFLTARCGIIQRRTSRP
jgi:hypothetical protein